MRITLGILILAVVFSACKKDKFTTVPQIKFKSISPDQVASNITSNNVNAIPKLTIHITDSEGDVGFKSGKDTSRIYIKNLVSNFVDSFFLPDIASAGVKNFEADVTVSLFDALDCKNPGPVRPRTDTTYYEVYIVDFAKNKSNVIKTDKPLYLRCL